jgi:hypothetical protein
MLSVTENRLAVYEHVLHAGRQVVWIIEFGVISDRGGVEHDDVGDISVFQGAPTVEPEVRGWE